MRHVTARRVGLGGLAAASVFCVDHRGERLKSCRRASRAALCAGRIATSYKCLAWHSAWRAWCGEPFDIELRRAEVHKSCAELALQMCSSNGGMFVKMGQHTATLGPAIPQEYVQALARLQDSAPAGPWEDVSYVLNSELNLGSDIIGPQGVFAKFDRQPVGSASLAQVHRAKLRDGSEVAVKVQHRGIESVVASDLSLVKNLDKVLGWLFKEEGFSMAWAIEEFEQNVGHELDFLEEAAHATQCRDFFRSRKDLHSRVHVPKIHQDLTTHRLLVMEFSRGVAISKLTDAVRKRASGRELTAPEQRFASAASSTAELLVQAFAAMCFSSGFVHCDPHPGNLLVEMDAESASRLVILDHGLYREISKERRLANCSLWKAMVLQDARALKASCAVLGIDSQTAELLPLYFTNRSMETMAGLGQPVTLREKEALKQKLLDAGLLPSDGRAASFVAVSGLGLLAHRLPGDMLMVMRTMHLVASLHRDLGGTATERFLFYAEAAVRGSATAPALEHAFFRARLCVREAYLWLWQLGSLEPREQFSIARSIAELAK